MGEAQHGYLFKQLPSLLLESAFLFGVTIALRETIDGLNARAGSQTADYWIASTIGIGVFVAAWIFARWLPERLPPPKILSRRVHANWALGAFRAVLTLLPIFAATLLAAYVAGTSVTFLAVPGGITATAELPGGSLLALGGADGRVRIVDLRSFPPSMLPPINAGDSPIADLALRAPHGRQTHKSAILVISTADGRVLRLENAGFPNSEPKSLPSLAGEGSKVHVALGPRGMPVAATESASGQVRLTSPYGEKDLSGGVVTALVALDEDIFAFATLDGHIRLSEAKNTGISILTANQDAPSLPGRVRKLRYDPATRTLTALGVDGTLMTVKVSGERFQMASLKKMVLPQLRLGPAVEWKSETARRRDRPLSPAELAALRPGSEFQECTACPRMVVVPAGRFLMGSPETENGRSNNEGPQHEVNIPKPFAVGKFEVTFDEWDACVAGGGCSRNSASDDRGWGRGARPVINVSWGDAQEYAAWLNSKIPGSPYRLLSESEWEYAARSGTTTRYSFGDDAASLDEYAWYSSNSENTTHAVGEKKPNEWGLHDMHGNVLEWVQDCYADNYSEAPKDGGSAGDTANCLRVLRGGSWVSIPRDLRAAYRNGVDPDLRNYYFGFRLARTLNP